MDKTKTRPRLSLPFLRMKRAEETPKGAQPLDLRSGAACVVFFLAFTFFSSSSYFSLGLRPLLAPIRSLSHHISPHELSEGSISACLSRVQPPRFCRLHSFLPSPWVFSAMTLRTLSSTLSTPFTVVGSGPTGLFLSRLLSRFGVDHLTLSSSTGVSPHPKAHYVNARTMEMLSASLPPPLFERLGNLAAPSDEWRRFHVRHDLLSPPIASIDHFETEEYR